MLASHNVAYSCCNFSMLVYPAVLNAVTSCTSAASRVTVLDPLTIARGLFAACSWPVRVRARGALPGRLAGRMRARTDRAQCASAKCVMISIIACVKFRNAIITSG